MSSGSADGGGGAGADWRPTASPARLRQRAEIIAWVRAFFRERGVLEVETPLLCSAGPVDAHIDPIPARCRAPGPVARRWLVTSPEHSMKRLLAAGSGPIYQITRAFRDGERGRLHNPEFAILEWYRPGWDRAALMGEVEDLFDGALREFSGAAASRKPFERRTYRLAFQSTLGIDPYTATTGELAKLAARLGAVPDPPDLDRDGWLDLLLVAGVQGALPRDRPVFMTDYPASQAAAAQIRTGDPPVADRFELYFLGVELANGYSELVDARQQRKRLLEANRARRALGKQSLPVDRRLLEAVAAGLPACSGVAGGLDRVIILARGAASFDEVVAFPAERA